MFYNTPLGQLPRYAHALLKSLSENPMKKRILREKIISHSLIALHMLSHEKTMCEKPFSKNSHKIEYNV